MPLNFSTPSCMAARLLLGPRLSLRGDFHTSSSGETFRKSTDRGPTQVKTHSCREPQRTYNLHTYKDEHIEEDHHDLNEAEAPHGGSWEADMWELGSRSLPTSTSLD